MDRILIIIVLAVLGLVLGSFAGAQVWRLRKRQLEVDKKNGEEYDKAELKRLAHINSRATADRSVCLQCGHQLAWYDLLPIVSWVSTKGRCRYCKKPIGWFEPMIELSVAIFFVSSLLLWPYDTGTRIEMARLVVWLISGVPLAILCAYDLRWLLLPDRMSILYSFLGLVYAVLTVVAGDTSVSSVVYSVAIMSGIYLLLYIGSRGKWIGFGDVKLGIGLGLFIANWQLALLALFLANLLGTIVVIPGMVMKKLNRRSTVPFGPFLILGTVVSVLVGPMIIEWYLGMFLI